MKVYINKEDKEDYNPCHGCETGWGSYSGGKDSKGEYIEVKSCRDNCFKLKLWNQKHIKT